MPVESVDTVVLPERPAALFYCANRRRLIVSTYQLEDESSRKGSLWFFDDEHKKVASLPMSAGVFRFRMFPDGDRVVASLTNGSISTVSLDSLSASDLVVNANSLLLSVSLCDGRVVTSDNHGSVHIVDLLSSEKITSFVAARLKFTNEPCEVWCTSWHDGVNFVLSGGEDAMLKLWDVRCDCQCVVRNSSHGSGVTFVKSEDENYCITGSYDEHLRRFDIRSFKKPVCEEKFDGGVWHAEEAGDCRLTVACMYGGWALVDAKTFSVVEKNKEIGNFLLYGATQCGVPSEIASCTFNNYAVNFDRITAS